jgi:acyl-coenzyme A thioesterase PaaI-like protein
VGSGIGIIQGIDMSDQIALQDRFAPGLTCFGCGPANEKGLRLKSFVEGNQVIATFVPLSHMLAFEGMVNGGIVGVLLDCHMNWAAAWQMMQVANLEKPPCCVTAKYEIAFEKPTPVGVPLEIKAWVTELAGRKSVVASTIGPAGEVTATGSGTFVAVKPGHPAYHRW